MAINLQSYASEFGGLKYLEPAPGVLEVIISNAHRRNATDRRMHRDLSLLWRAVDQDVQVRAVLVRGDGEHFSAGGDFEMIEGMLNDETTLLQTWKEASDIVYNIIGCSKPIVSAIRGVAVGAGLAVALLADISIAGEDARLLDGHTRLGVAAGDHAVIIWPLLCGLAKSRYYLLLNDTLTGEEAERIGLVARCVEADQVYATALDAASRLAQGSATAIRWTKHALNSWLRQAGPNFDASLALEFFGFRLRDAQEGFAAVKGKRAPTFDQGAI